MRGENAKSEWWLGGILVILAFGLVFALVAVLPEDADVPYLGAGPFVITATLVFVAPGWVIVDAFHLSRKKWKESGKKRYIWVSAAFFSMFLPGIGLVLSVAYWMFIRPKVQPNSYEEDGAS